MNLLKAKGLANRLKSSWWLLALLLIILLGISLRLYNLGGESLWYDEVRSVAESHLSIQQMCSQSNQPPLYFLILNLWMRLFGTSDAALRLPSAIFGSLAVAAIYGVGKLLFDRKTALIGAFLAAISYFLISYSQEVRGYSLLMLLSVLSYFFFIRILKHNRLRDFLAYFLCNLLLGYTHVYGLFIIISQVLYFVLWFYRFRPQLLKFIIVQVASVLSFLPLAWLLWSRVEAISDGAMFWESKPTALTLAVTLAKFSGAKSVQAPLLAIFLICAGLGVISIRKTNGRWLWRNPLDSLKGMDWNMRFERIEDTSLLIIWMCVPIAIGFIISVVTNPMYTDRYVICAAPAFYLLVARGIAGFNSKTLAFITLGVILILSAIGLQRYYSQPGKEQWRQTAQYVETHQQLNDVILLSGYGRVGFDYYYSGDLPEFISPGTNDPEKVAAVLEGYTGNRRRAWFILDHGDSARMRETIVGIYGDDAVMWEKQYEQILLMLVDVTASAG